MCTFSGNVVKVWNKLAMLIIFYLIFSCTNETITITDVQDENIDCWKIETPTATYFFDKIGAGFTSILDSEGNDWISWNAEKGWGGSNRGIPNMVHHSNGNYFHPGPEGNQSDCSLQYIEGVPTITCLSSNKAWECKWEFFETHATMTVTKSGGKYWFLYEGTPGGSYSHGDDWFMLSDGTQKSVGEDSFVDIPAPEWIVYGDHNVEDVLFLAHHQDDEIGDYQLGQDVMVIFGFGRFGDGEWWTEKGLENQGEKFSIGFLKTKDHQELNKKIIDLIK